MSVKARRVSSLQQHVNDLVDEDALIMVNERQTLNQEKDFVKQLMKREQLVAEHDGQVLLNCIWVLGGILTLQL